MGEEISGDCDDEDGCGGSGIGEVKRVMKITDCKSMILFPSYILRVNLTYFPLRNTTELS